jgi:hypothetical protein
VMLVVGPVGHRLSLPGLFPSRAQCGPGLLGPDASSPTVPTLPGTPLHRAPARPGLHGPAGHRIPSPRATPRACPGQLPPPLPAPSPR